MGNIIRVVTFMVVVMLGFTGFTLYGIPLIVPAAPPVEEVIGDDMTMDKFVALGEKIYNGKGTCTLCHNSLGLAPMLEPVASVAPDRMADPRYKEQGGIESTIGGYILESMVKPSAYVVKGFGKKGSNDSVSPMPDVSTGAISMSAVEIDAVIAFLESTAGIEISVSLPTGDVPVEEETAEAVPAETATEAFSKFGCDACHMGPGIEEGGDMGPDLSAMGANAGKRVKGQSAEQFLVNSIIDPNAVIAEGFDEDMMPDDFAEQMMVSELNMMVNAILGKK